MPIFAGCVSRTDAADTGSGACLAFLDAIKEAQFAALQIETTDIEEYLPAYYQALNDCYTTPYAMLDESLKNLTGAPPSEEAPSVTLTEFSERYTTIFLEMGLKDSFYEVINVADMRTLSSVDYRLTYITEATEPMTLTFSMTAEKKGTEWRVMWSPALVFPDLDWGDTILYGILQPKRGEIFGADGELLAQNITGLTVFCVPSKIDLGDNTAQFGVKALFAKEDEELSAQEANEKFWYEPFWNQVAGISELKVDAQQVRNALSRTYRDMTRIAVLYPDQMTPELEARILAIPSLGIDNSSFSTLREYPNGEFLGHILGFAGIIQKEYIEEYDKNGERNRQYLDDPYYDRDSWLGYMGLEKQYEKVLRGEKGSFAYIQKKTGRNVVLFMNPARDGEDLHLSIKPKLQRRVEEVYNTIVTDDEILGTVIVLNPKTGAVEAMYSKPGYDPNKFTRGEFTEAEWNFLLNEDKTAPLLNRCIQGLYPPGSTFKILTAACTLESGAFGPNDIFPSSERVRIDPIAGDVWFPTARGGEFAHTGIAPIRRTGNSNRHTPANMESSIIDSDNIYFSYCALKMGWDTFIWYLEKIGMSGTPTVNERGETVTTGIAFDLPVLAPQIKNPESDRTWDLLAMTGYGQGELLITPLQMACYAGAFANGGDIMTPYLVGSTWRNADISLPDQRIPDLQGFLLLRNRGYEQVSAHQPTVWRNIASQANVDAIVKGMVGVCRSRHLRGYERGGTAKDLGVTSFVIAGKTGTAEIGTKPEGSKLAPKELAWFIGFRYLDGDGNPLADADQRLVLVMLELEADKMPPEASMMKFLIARALLMRDPLTSDDSDDDYLKMITF
ncbi:MAG: penicillin-binding transpeptidase domain-containing protein [Clostridiales bacterium]|nr:penicillin-binding transpeptidase domain-containing protein [Clostridiales bacterium]